MIPLILLAASLSQPGDTVQIDAALLSGLPVVSVERTTHDKKQVCEGASLASVLVKLGLPNGENLREPALSQAIVVRSKDGYEVAFSLAELDAMLGNKTAIIATTCDGAELPPGDGPYRLIVPGERRPARSSKMIASIRLK